MSHSSREADEKIRQMIRQMMEDAYRKDLIVGPTGRFPNGKLTPSDEGEIKMGVAHANGRVIVDFGKPVAWMGMLPQEARVLAETIIRHAREVEQETKVKP